MSSRNQIYLRLKQLQSQQLQKMADNTKTYGIYQRQLIKDNKKNTNTINLINNLNHRFKRNSLEIEPQTMIFPNKPGQKYSVQKSGEKYGKSNKETEFFNNAKLQPHNNKIPSNKIKNLGSKHNQRQQTNLNTEFTKHNQGKIQKYNTQSKLVAHSLPQDTQIITPKTGFSKSKRRLYTEEMIESRRHVPGPGQYNVPKSNGSASATKFGRESKLLVRISPYPGPGVYNCQRSQLSRRGGVISRQKKYYSQQNNSPGPASYASISLSKIKQNTTSVVIGRYEGNRSQDKKPLLPGPGQYQLTKQPKQSRILGGKIGKQKKNTQKLAIIPGPQRYSPKYEEVLTRSPTCKIGSQIRQTSQTSIYNSKHANTFKLRRSSHENNLLAIIHDLKQGVLTSHKKLRSRNKKANL